MGTEYQINYDRKKFFLQNNFAALICLGAGIAMIGYSLLEFPTIWLNPVPFLKHISAGTMLIIFGVAFFVGPFEYLKGLFSKDKIKTTIVTYTITSLFGLYASMYGCGVYFTMFVGLL